MAVTPSFPFNVGGDLAPSPTVTVTPQMSKTGPTFNINAKSTVHPAVAIFGLLAVGVVVLSIIRKA